MKKELYIQIPEPCHEDWNQMTPVEQGRFCQSCCKEVVDFSVMTDQEIISFLSKPRGKTCGNFASDQLNRIITEPATPAKKKFWVMMLSFLLPLAISFKGKAQFRKKKSVDTTQTATTREPNRPTLGKIAVKCKVEPVTELRGDTIVFGEAQKSYEIIGTVTDEKGTYLEGAVIAVKNQKEKTVTNSSGDYKIYVNKNVTLVISAAGFETREVVVTRSSAKRPLIVGLYAKAAVENVVVVGMISYRPLESKVDAEEEEINLSGSITDTSGNPIPSASIEMIGTNNGTAANANGEFTLKTAKERNFRLRISALGFETKEITLSSKEATQKQNIILLPQVKTLDDVIVVSSGSNLVGNYRLGGYSTGVRIRESVMDTVIDLVTPSTFKIYPNPASRNTFVNIKLSQKGNYQLNLSDNQGKLIQQNKFIISFKNVAYQQELPQSIAAGIYYITVLDEATRKQYTQKLIVQ